MSSSFNFFLKKVNLIFFMGAFVVHLLNLMINLKSLDDFRSSKKI